MRWNQRCLALLTLPLFVGCGDSKPKAKQDPNPPAQAKAIDAGVVTPQPGTQTHANGMQRFTDPGVYVDGKALGVLRFGEIPTPLPVAWHEERAAVPFKAGDPGPRYRIARQRRYRFSDYFRAMGVDIAKIKEMHLYGGNRKAAAVVIPGKSIREMDEFRFRFGGDIWGKPLPACPAGVGDGKCPDQIGSIAVYIEKDPPKREGGHFYFNGERVEGIPYFGEPLRGGIRVYFDGPLVTTIKRNKLKASDIRPVAVQGDAETYRLIDFLKTQNVDVDKVQEAWLVAYERRVAKISRTELLKTKFTVTKGAKGEILVGPGNIETHVISLHSNPLTPDDLPKLTKEEMEKADG